MRLACCCLELAPIQCSPLQARYCSELCHAQHWTVGGHRQECAALQQAAAEEEGAEELEERAAAAAGGWGGGARGLGQPGCPWAARGLAHAQLHSRGPS